MEAEAEMLLAAFEQRRLMDPSNIPEGVREALDGYVEHGWRPGGFVEAVLCNDLAGAIRAADMWSMRALPAIVSYVYNELPSPCWGSREKYEAWINVKLAQAAEPGGA